MCRGQLRTGCAHEECGHLHRNEATHDCWTRWHDATPAQREQMKKKRVQPTVRGPAAKRTKRTTVRGADRAPRKRRRQPEFEPAEEAED